MTYSFWHKDFMTDEQIDEVFYCIQNEPALARTLWYDGPPLSLEAFKNKVKEWWFVRVASANDETVGIFWLNGYQGRTAQIHFAVFDKHRAESARIGSESLLWLGEQGWLHSLYGLTPSTHRHVFPFLQSIGLEIIGRLPGACWIERKQKYVDGILSVYDFRRDQ